VNKGKKGGEMYLKLRFTKLHVHSDHGLS